MLIQGVTLTGTYVVDITNVTRGLVLHYDPSKASSYPGSGTTLYDLTANGLNGTMSNITYTSPYFSYNGSTSQVAIADNALLEAGSGDWTMEAWVSVANTTGGKVILGKFDNGGMAADVSYSIRVSNSDLYAQMGDGLGGYINSTAYTLSINTWVHVVYVWTNIAANTLETYVNGASIGSVSHSLASLLNTPNGVYLGSYNGGEYSQWYNGKIGITRLYNRALTSDEVLQNYNTNRGLYGL